MIKITFTLRRDAVNKNTCCFLGHRKVKITEELKIRLESVVEKLIVKENVDTFLFGSKSQFDDLCYQTVSRLKIKHSNIKRVYVRAEYPYIDDDYTAYLLKSYEKTYFPEKMIKAGKSAYVERNCEMINRSKFCIFYFDKNYVPFQENMKLMEHQMKSGTKLAFEYAHRKEKTVINVFI